MIKSSLKGRTVKNNKECRPIKERTVKNSGLVSRRSKSKAVENSDKELKEAEGENGKKGL